MREAIAIVVGILITLALPAGLRATELHPVLEEKLQGKSSQERRAILQQECGREKPHHRHGHHVADIHHAKRLADICKELKKPPAPPSASPSAIPPADMKIIRIPK